MLNLISNSQMRAADAYTLESRDMKSVDLMENACTAFVRRFVKLVQPEEKIVVFCGMGNNGGDGLAIARLLRLKGFRNLEVYILIAFKRESEDFRINRDRLKSLKVNVTEIRKVSEVPDHLDVVIDAVLGSGYKEGLDAFLAASFEKINRTAAYIVSVDCPSGWHEELNGKEEYHGIRASNTISFQRPKLPFLFPDSLLYTRQMDFVHIGLDEDFIQNLPADYFWIEQTDIVSRLKERHRFSHKGTYGHVLAIAGSEYTIGAAVLCATSALFSGAGLVTACIPENSFSTVVGSQPEIMTMDAEELHHNIRERYDAVAVGPGIGMGPLAIQNIKRVLENGCPAVFDADALTVLVSENLIGKLPVHSILTPHMKEFDRLFGAHETWKQRLETARNKAMELGCVVVLKNQYSFICDSNGKVYINSTGNPSMAQGGMGDVLTGCIAAFLAQGYTACDAALLGCYVHGKSGDELAVLNEVTPASLVARNLTRTLKKLNDSRR